MSDRIGFHRIRFVASAAAALLVGSLLGRIHLLPDTSRRMEIVFVLAFALVLLLWSLVDALIVIVRIRRRLVAGDLENPSKGRVKYLFRQIPPAKGKD